MRGKTENFIKREVVYFKISKKEEWLKSSTVSFGRAHEVFFPFFDKKYLENYIFKRGSCKRLSILLSGYQSNLKFENIPQYYRPPLLLLGPIYHLVSKVF